MAEEVAQHIGAGKDIKSYRLDAKVRPLRDKMAKYLLQSMQYLTSKPEFVVKAWANSKANDISLLSAWNRDVQLQALDRMHELFPTGIQTGVEEDGEEALFNTVEPEDSVDIDSDSLAAVVTNSDAPLHLESVRTYCLCNTTEDGPDFIACENPDCNDPDQWYHFDCVNVDANNLPDTWFCPLCEPLVNEDTQN
jgi:hypothetical protein